MQTGLLFFNLSLPHTKEHTILLDAKHIITVWGLNLYRQNPLFVSAKAPLGL